MKQMKKSLIESMRVIKEGYVTLSGKVDGISGWGRKQLERLYKNKGEGKTGTEKNLQQADICFRPFGDMAVQLVKEQFGHCTDSEEAFLIELDQDIVVYAASERAKLYAIMALTDTWEEGWQKGIIYSYPAVEHRSVRVFMPPKRELPYFKRFIDMLVHLGYNAILLEIGGVMEYKRHPEINETWAQYCRSMQEYNDKPYDGSSVYCRTKNSVHTFNGNGDIYSQEEMKELTAYCAERQLEIIPEVPSLSHSEYFLISHPELRECEDEPFASTACPSNEGLYELVFDLYDEVIEVFSPRTLHIGHDEWWVMCVCDRCKDRPAAELFAENVKRCYDYLKERGIRTMMWADKMVRLYEKTGEAQGGARKEVYNVETDQTLNVMGREYPLYRREWFEASEEAKQKGFHHIIHDTADCMALLPEDIMCLNWYWAVEPQVKDAYLQNGRYMIYGNARSAGLINWRERVAAGAKGISISNWIDSSEYGMQHWNTLFDLGYGAVLCWKHDRRERDHARNLRDTFDGLYQIRNGEVLESSYLEVVHTAVKTWKQGEQYYHNLPYTEADRITLGAYRVTYEDGGAEEFPVLYGINIGTADALSSRWCAARDWQYVVDVHLTTVASVCNFEERDGEIRYRTVFPLRGKVASCEYRSAEGMENYVRVDEMREHIR